MTPTVKGTLLLLGLVVTNIVLAQDGPEVRALPEPLRLNAGPYVRHKGMGEVEIAWETKEPVASSLEYGQSSALGTQLPSDAAGRKHRVHLRGLKPDTNYYFRLAALGTDGERRATKLLRFDSASDLTPASQVTSPSPYPRDDLTAVYARAARHIVERTGITKGYCLDLGCGDGRLAYELAKRTGLQIIGVDEDADKVATARLALDKAGLYGVRVTVEHADLTKLPYTKYFANLIVSACAVATGRLPGRHAEVLRVLRPCGGIAFLGQPGGVADSAKLSRSAIGTWLGESSDPSWHVREGDGRWVVARRGPLPAAGEWSHLYADAGNSSCSGDELRAPVQIQWFGKPGPRNMVDRHHRAPGALMKDGRVFLPGNNRVLAFDAYNGTMLWDMGVPNSRRVGAPKDSGQMVARDDLVYVAVEEKCLALDAETGEPSLVFETPVLPGHDRLQWGYVASTGMFLFGSGTKKGAPRTGHSKGSIIDGIYYDSKSVVTSVCLFAANRHTGERLWTYRRDGGSAIINSAIAVGERGVYFVESRNPEAVSAADGRATLATLLAKGHAYLVKLRKSNGKEEWARRADLSELRHVLFLCCSQGTVLAVGSRNEGKHPRYDLHAFDADDGKLLWSNHYLRANKPIAGSHGEQDQHPVIVGDTVYSRPCAFDLRTGTQQPFNLDRAGHGCGTISGSAHYLYGRGGNPQCYPLSQADRASIPLTRVTRPGCWINIIPAGGLVLIPESSSGCTCGYALQTSLALAPKSR